MVKSICDNCLNKNCLWRAETKSYATPVMSCRGFKKALTYADKIRAMTDEELAMLLNPTCPTRECPDKLPWNEAHDCYKCWLDWLKQEVNNG